MATFTVTAWASISLYKEIEAETREQAEEIANELGMPSPSHQAYLVTENTWSVGDAHLNEPQEITVE